MGWGNTTLRYGSVAIALHWLTFLMIVTVYALIELREFYPRGSDPREMLKAWHFTLGVGVFLLLLARLALRLVQPSPAIEPELARWQILLSRAVHAVLYAFMALMPLLGLLILSAEGETALFNGLRLPALIPVNPALAERLQELHEAIGTFGYFLIGLHAAAALFHHYFLHDNTLARMLPARKAP